MRKSTLIIGTLLLCPAAVNARTISVEEASRLATGFKAPSSTATRIKAVTPDAEPVLVYTEHDNGDDLYYIFNRPGRGFIIISADDKAKTVLAYSESTEITDIKSLPENMRAWLGEYARQIKMAINSTSARAPRHAQRAAVSPLLTTKWGQEKPFNLECPQVLYPTGSMDNAVTGCVATAMAQVMNYHKLSTPASGGVEYTWNGQQISRSFDGHVYDWDNMLDDYSVEGVTDAQKAAVAMLMADAAYSVAMQFSATSSAAATQSVPYALCTYFGYDAAMLYEERDLYTDADWEDKICDELESQRPVIYSGKTKSGSAHTWVIDGTDGNGMYHINWGWNGYQNDDTYFALTGADILAPEIGGTGGATIKEGYLLEQAAVFGIQPNVGGEIVENFVSLEPEVLSQTSLERPYVVDLENVDDYFVVLNGSFMNHSMLHTLFYCEFALRFTNVATGETLIVQMPLTEDAKWLDANMYIPYIAVPKEDLNFLPSGEYTVEAMYTAYKPVWVGDQLFAEGDGEWHTFRHSATAPVSQKLTLTGTVPSLYISERLETLSTTLDHLAFKVTLHANEDIDTYVASRIFEEAPEGGYGQLMSKPDMPITHVEMKAGETETYWLGEWQYEPNGDMPAHLLLQLSLTDSAEGQWDGNNLMQPYYYSQAVFIPTPATAIADIRTSKVKVRPEVYTIGGQRVGNTDSRLKPGLYIIDGKKVIVK